MEIEKVSSIDNSEISSSTKQNFTLGIEEICSMLKVEREILPNSESIEYAVKSLPRELNKIPKKFMDKDVAKMCVAIAAGLYDDAILRIWNNVIKALRSKINVYGPKMIKAVAGENYTEKNLNEIKDYDLLLLSRQLNLISESGYFYLNQCREIRNNVSIAHPTEMELSENELINFINRCVRYGLKEDYEKKGIDIRLVVDVISSDDTSDEQLDIISEQLAETFISQRELIWKMLYGNATNEETKTNNIRNSLYIAEKTSKLVDISDEIEAHFIEKHDDYRIRDQKPKVKLSLNFLERIGKVNNIREAEKISIYNKAINEMQEAHLGAFNFYNEPSVAEKLCRLHSQFNPTPDLVNELLVKTVLQCYLGNDYGISTAAEKYYIEILLGLSPKGKELLFRLPRENEHFKKEIEDEKKLKRYKILISKIHTDELTTTQRKYYDEVFEL
ncbi:TPA: hypothetical protein ACGX5B_002197 [Listeria monocytogenes]